MGTKQSFSTINGLRGVAAFCVVAFHYSFRDALHMEMGPLAVDLFFVLSGFVIAHSYDERLSSDLSLERFIAIRLIRLYPLYILGTALAILVAVSSLISHGGIIGTNENGVRSIPFSLVMLPTPPFGPSSKLYPLNVPAWSLFFEIAVNIVYAASVRFWTILNLFVLVFAAGATMVIALVTNQGGFGDGGGHDWSSFHIGLARVLYSFPMGVLLYKLYRARLVVPPAIPGILVVLAFPLLLMLPSGWVTWFCVLVGFPVLVALSATSKAKGTTSSAFAALGAVSYAIYVVHAPLHDLVTAIVRKLVATPSDIWVDGLLMAALFPVGILLDRFYDTPLRKLLARNVGAKQPSQ